MTNEPAGPHARQRQTGGPSASHGQPPAQSGTRGWLPAAFAICGVLVALITGGLYMLRPETGPGPSAGLQRRTPQAAVEEFLAAVFLANDAERTAAVLCAGWDPADAVARTRADVDQTARVSWDEITVMSAADGRANVRARLGLRFAGDKQPTVFRPWRFSLVDESGWRVCEARPFAT